MASSNTDFLRFSAYSLKDLITRKMSENSKFTDQIYEGSNLAILIDLCAYLYQCLVYQLNSAAAESMFSDTQIYENINRLVKLIGYNPRGCRPSEIVMYISNEGAKFENKAILPFSYIDTGMVDSRGKSICFSTGYNDEQIDSTDVIGKELYHKVRLYNGRWHLYSKVLTAGGTDNELFTLDGLKSDEEDGRFVAFEHIKVFVEHNDGASYDTDWYADVENIFIGQSKNSSGSDVNLRKVFNNQEKIYSVRLNEDKVYEIKFGDGIVGKKLEAGDRLYVFYLETNGQDGNIDLLDLPDGMLLRNSPSDFGISKTLYDKLIRKSYSIDVFSDETQYTYSFSDSVVQAEDEESVEDIRENAPSWFNAGNRLITKADYEYWVKNNRSGVIDVKCMNNWQYLTTFYRWLYQYAVKYHQNPSYYFDKDKITRYNCKYIDAADANNVYLWVKTQQDTDSIQNEIQQACQSIKTMTAEVNVLKPVTVYFDVCAAREDDAVDLYDSQDEFGKGPDGEYDSYIEVTLDDSVMYVNSDLKQAIVSIFKQYFDKRNCTLGQLVDYSVPLREMYGLNGVKDIRTVFVRNGDTLNARIVNGLSLASWSDRLIEYGEDMQIGNVSRQLEDFQFPSLLDEDSLVSKIKIVKKQLTNINTIKY